MYTLPSILDNEGFPPTEEGLGVQNLIGEPGIRERIKVKG